MGGGGGGGGCYYAFLPIYDIVINCVHNQSGVCQGAECTPRRYSVYFTVEGWSSLTPLCRHICLLDSLIVVMAVDEPGTSCSVIHFLGNISNRKLECKFDMLERNFPLNFAFIHVFIQYPLSSSEMILLGNFFHTYYSVMSYTIDIVFIISYHIAIKPT